MFKRILVALSGTVFTPSAIENAVDLAKRHNADLTGVTLVDLGRLANVGPIPMGGGAAAHSIIEHRIAITEDRIRQTVEQFRKSCEDAGIRHDVIQESGDPLTQLTAHSRYHDFTIFGMRGLFEYGVVHNPDDQVIRMLAKGVRPILTVAEQFRIVRRVLIGYNGSMESATAMKRFVQLRLWPDMAVKIVHFPEGGRSCSSLLENAARYCRSHGIDAETEEIPGDSSAGLLDHAHACEADLLVIGASSRARIFRHMLGDTALHLIRNADIPLFMTQ